MPSRVLTTKKIVKHRRFKRNRRFKRRTGPLNIMKVNRSPIPFKREMVFHWDSYCNFTVASNTSSSTSYLSLISIADPTSASNTAYFSNRACPWYSELMGTTAGHYAFFKVHYVDVYLTMRNVSSNVQGQVCVGVAPVTSDINSSTWIHNLATRSGTMTKVLEQAEQGGDYAKFKFRVYPHEVLGIPRAAYLHDTDYLYPYTADGLTGPFIYVSIGDASASTEGTSSALTMRGHVQLDYHCTICKPCLANAEG